jgi:hypothetical protein
VNTVGMGPRPLLGMVLAWLAVVVGVGAITFVVVDRTGRAVGQASAADSVLALPLVTSSGSPSPRPSASRSATVPAPSSSASVGPGSTPRPSRPSSGSTPTVVQAEPRTASFSTDGGTVVATCEGTRISLESIRPRDGWSFEQESEHGGLEVQFTSGERQVEMLVTCVQGMPTRSET